MLGSDDIPKFIVSQSLGALIAAQTVVQNPTMFKGVSFITPFFNLSEKDQMMFEKLQPLAKIINFVYPSYKINVRRGRKIRKWILNWADDPIYTGGTMAVSNILKVQ